MNDILISCLMFDGVRSNFRGDGATAPYTYNWYNGLACGTTRSDLGVPTYISSGLIHNVNVLRIQQGDTPSTRIIGLKLGTNPDGSYRIRLLGNNVPYRTNRKWFSYGITSGINNNSPSMTGENNYSAEMVVAPTPNMSHYGFVNGHPNDVNYGAYGITSFATQTTSNILCENNITELSGLGSYISNSNRCNLETQGDGFPSSITTSLLITTNKDTSVGFGFKNVTDLGYNVANVYVDNWYTIKYGQIDPMLGLTGNTYDYVCEMLQKIQPTANGQIVSTGLIGRKVTCPEDYLHYTANDFYFGTSYDNLHITSSYDQAIEYLNNGTIPDDDEYRERNPDNPEPYSGEPQPPEPPEPPESQVANEDNDIPEHTSRAEYNVVTSNTLIGINWYYIHKSILEGFIDWFWNDISDWSSIVVNWVTGLYGDLQNAIVSLKKINVADKYLIGQADNTTEIKLARYTCSRPIAGNYLQEIKSELKQLQYAGGISFTESSDLYSFLNYSPYTQVSLYLPYVGVVPLETRYIRGATLNVACGCSFQTGEIIYRVQMGDCDVAYYQGKCSEDVPFSLNSAMELATNTVNAIGNVSAGLVTGGVATASSMLLGQNISAPTNTNASVTSTLNKYLGSKCAIIVQRPQHYKLYDVSQGKTVNDFGHVSGFKYNCIRTFSNGDGYVEFSNPHIDNWNTAPTDEETQEIYSLMQQGIVL